MRLALAVVVVSSVGFAQGSSLPGTQASRLSLGAVEGSIATPELPPMPQPPSVNLSALHVRLIDQQIQMLELQKLSLAGPVFLTVFGGAGVVAGFVFLAAQSLFGFAIVAGIAAVPLIGGILWVVVNSEHNGRIDEAVASLKEERRTQLGVATAMAPRVEMPMVELASF